MYLTHTCCMHLTVVVIEWAFYLQPAWKAERASCITTCIYDITCCLDTTIPRVHDKPVMTNHDKTQVCTLIVSVRDSIVDRC
jgi:hypothetical protein